MPEVLHLVGIDPTDGDGFNCQVACQAQDITVGRLTNNVRTTEPTYIAGPVRQCRWHRLCPQYLGHTEKSDIER